MDSFSSELGCDFSIRLEAPHVIDCSRQVMCNYMPEFNLSFKGSDSASLHHRLGQLIIDVCSVTPNGVLVFCASYWWIEMLSQTWRANGQWDTLNSIKSVYMEPKFNDKNFTKLLKNFQAAACTSKGAVMIAVCRGKISEGLDLSDRCCCCLCVFAHSHSSILLCSQAIARCPGSRRAFPRRQRSLRSTEKGLQHQVHIILHHTCCFHSTSRLCGTSSLLDGDTWYKMQVIYVFPSFMPCISRL